MLRLTDLRKVAARSGARDISKVEIDIILTYLLQLFVEKEITKHVAFKAGTMLRKMVFGARGRLSTAGARLWRKRRRRCELSYLSPQGRGRIASPDAIRVRGLSASQSVWRVPSPEACATLRLRPLPSGER
jgi:hypothetical protein